MVQQRPRERERESESESERERVYWEQVILHIIVYSYSSNSRVPDGRTQEVGVDMFGEAGDHEG
jgi:hypothetical protein